MNVREYSFAAPRGVSTNITVSTNSAQSAALNCTDAVYVCTVASHILVGVNPTATTSCMYVPAGTLVRLTDIKLGEKIAAIAGGAGVAYIGQGL